MKSNDKRIAIASAVAAIILSPTLHAQTSEAFFWADLKVSTPDAGSMIGSKTTSFSGAFKAVTFEGDAPSSLANEVYGEWSFDVASERGEIAWNADKTRVVFDNIPGDVLVFTNPTLNIIKHSDHLTPLNNMFYAGIVPDERLMNEIYETIAETKCSVFVTDGKGYVEVAGKDFAFALGSTYGKESFAYELIAAHTEAKTVGYDSEAKALSTADLSYVFFNGKEFQEFKNGDDFNAEVRFGASFQSFTAIPEPSSALLSLCASALFLRRRRNK